VAGYVRTPQYGGTGGQAFSDDLTQVARVTNLGCNYTPGKGVDAIAFQWLMNDGTTDGASHGGQGQVRQFIFDVHGPEEGEYVDSITVRADSRVRQITFRTNHNRTFGPYGADTGTTYEISVPSVWGAFGRSGSALDAVGFLCPASDSEAEPVSAVTDTVGETVSTATDSVRGVTGNLLGGGEKQSER
jgi:hypothetical protein